MKRISFAHITESGDPTRLKEQEPNIDKYFSSYEKSLKSIDILINKPKK
jgi:hypothetical protein